MTLDFSNRQDLPLEATSVSPTEIFAVFEGGGARGIAHLGAYKAAQDLGLTIRHVAGTSAGAIVAALIAAGYDADRLIDPAAQQTVLSRIRRIQPIDLFGGVSWRLFKKFRWLWARIFRLGSAPVGSFAALLAQEAALTPVRALLALGLCWSLWKGQELWEGWCAGAERLYRWVFGLWLGMALRLPEKALAFVLGLLIGGITFLAFKTKMGWFSTDRVRTELNAILYCGIHGLKEAPDDCPDVLFSHLPRRLKVVATNVDSREMVVFSIATDDVPVADAVAASLCIPAVFRPKTIWRKQNQNGEAQIESYRCVDGGLVSNIPTWLFDEERLANPGTPTVAFQLEDPPVQAKKDLQSYFVGLAKASVFGRQRLEGRGIEDMVPIEVPADLDMMDFDLTWPKAETVYIDAYRQARYVLDIEIATIPSAMRGFCKAVHTVVSGLLPGDANIRVSIALREEELLQFVRIRYSYNMDRDADDRLLLPLQGSVVGQAIDTRDIVHCNMSTSPHVGLAGQGNKYRRALVWPGMNHCIAVPLFAEPLEWGQLPSRRADAIGTLNIDSDTDLNPIYLNRPILSTFSVELVKLLTSTRSGGNDEQV